MKLGGCPCCGSRNVKKIQGEVFVCLDCDAPLQFTWGARYTVGFLLLLTIPSLLQNFYSPVLVGALAVLGLSLVYLYYRYRQFHLDTSVIDGLRCTANDELRYAEQFLSEKIGAIDFINKMENLTEAYGKHPTIQQCVVDHFNQVGGMSLEAQAQAAALAYPEVDFNRIAEQQQEAANAMLTRLTAYQVKI